jgi:hypothetical protein
MTNIFKTPEKVELRNRLHKIGVQVLEAEGWTVERVVGMGKASVRQITKGSKRLLVSIRTSQDRSIAFPPKPKGAGWETLDDVDVVLAVSVDDRHSPKNARVHWLDADQVRARFNRAATARKGHYKERPGRGIWLPLYKKDDGTVLRHIGAGLGLDYPPIAIEPLGKSGESRSNGTSEIPLAVPAPNLLTGDKPADRPLTMNEAKRGLALTFGVPESAIRITIEA